MHIVAVILAAGSGTRLGGVAKALIQVGGVLLVQRLIAAVRDAGIADVLVVTGDHHAAIGAAIEPTGARVLRNADFARGQGGSVRQGLQGSDPQADAVLILLCDQPLLTASDLTDLVDAFGRRTSGEFVVPRIGGTRRGNPVLASRRVVQAILASDRYTACRDYMDAHPETVFYLDTGNDHYVVDIDTPEDLTAVQARLGSPVQMPAQAEPIRSPVPR